VLTEARWPDARVSAATASALSLEAIDDGRVLTVLCQRACDGGIDGAAAAGVASDISGEGPDDQTPRLDEFQHIGHRTGWLLWPVVWKLGPDAQQHDWHFVLG